jgi:LPXTG-site transpeptidase (sortase) family protein
MLHIPQLSRITPRIAAAFRLALLLVVVSATAMPGTRANAAVTQPGLGVAGSFAVLAGAGITNTGPTRIHGNVGSSPDNSVTGFPPGQVTDGKVNNSLAAAAQGAFITTFATLGSETGCTSLPDNVGTPPLTLVPGVYCFSSAALLTGTLILDTGGNANALFIFKVPSQLTTASGSTVRAINGSACNVWWRVGTLAAIGTTSRMVGNILAGASVTMNTGATLLPGRALAQTASVTLNNNRINMNACNSASGGESGGENSSDTTAGQPSTLPVRHLPATGFEPSALPILSDSTMLPAEVPFLTPASSATLGQIIFPAAQVSASIVEAPRSGDTWDVGYLGAAVGHLAGTGWLDDANGNIVLAGHVNDRSNGPGAFTYLPQVKIGDVLILRVGDHETSYHVTSVSRATARDTKFVTQDGSRRVTLITCFWDSKLQSFSGRFVVVAIP